MDWSGIIVAVIALVGTFTGSALGIRQSNKVVNLRIDNLEKKMDKHNDLVERMAIAEKDIKSTCERVKDLEKALPRMISR
ncbi:MAG: hypothetical protein GX811_03415 [Lentisphaerae bacterium]|nr:hypothetical protein [Lentisphaerota bacterium]